MWPAAENREAMDDLILSLEGSLLYQPSPS